MAKYTFKKPNNTLEFTLKGNNTVPVVPDDMYVKCKKCRSTVLSHDFKNNLYVCPVCQGHYRIGARERINLIADGDSFKELNGGLTSKNIINFPEYEEKLSRAKFESDENEGVITGVCEIMSAPAAIFAMEPRFMMGSMGAVVGEKIARLFEYAAENKLCVVGFTVSGGARMQEGMFSLMQMAKTSGAVKLHSEAGLFYLTVLTDPTTGGVTASFAMGGDIILSEPDATVGFAGARVIEQTLKQKLPPSFQTAEFVKAKGFIDNIVERKDLKSVISMLIDFHSGGQLV